MSGAATIIVYAFGVFFKPLSQEFHVGRGAISFAFTLQNLTAAYGYAFGSFVIAGVAGTLLMGLGFDWTKSYTAPLAGFFLTMLTAAGLMLRLGPYRFTAGNGQSEQALGALAGESLG